MEMDNRERILGFEDFLFGEFCLNIHSRFAFSRQKSIFLIEQEADHIDNIDCSLP